MNLQCKIFGHNWKTGWAGAKSGYFGAIVVEIKSCKWCDKTEYQYTTSIKPLKQN